VRMSANRDKQGTLLALNVVGDFGGYV
jgi:hypothetical protein